MTAAVISLWQQAVGNLFIWVVQHPVPKPVHAILRQYARLVPHHLKLPAICKRWLCASLANSINAGRQHAQGSRLSMRFGPEVQSSQLW